MGVTGAMMDEIREQPGLLGELWETREAWTAPFVELCRAHRFERVLVVGNGSPYYAGETLCCAIERLLGANAQAIPAAFFHNHGSFDATGQMAAEKILLICPAETGHSKGQVDAARKARALGIPVACTTLNPQGVLARECDVVLAKPGGPERSIAATKNQTMALFLVLTCLVEASRALGGVTDAEYERLVRALAEVPANISRSIEAARAWCEDNRERLLAAPAFFLVGYGANFGTVREGALKFYETHERPTYAFELEETLHGPLRALHANDMVLFLSAEAGPERERMARLLAALVPRCKNLVRIMSEAQAAAQDAGDALVVSSGDVAYVNAIEYLVALQVIAAELSRWLGIDCVAPKLPELDEIMLPAYED